MDWNGSVVKPPSFEDEGALHIGKGKFLLSMSSEKGDKRVSTRTKVVLAIVAAVVVITVLIVTVLLVGHQPNSIPYRWNLRELLGSNLGAISSELKVSESDWIQQADGVFQLKEPLKVSGISYKLLLNFDANAKLRGFEYVADYKVDSGRAASDIYKAATDLRIQTYDPTGIENVELNTLSLREYFQKNCILDVRATNGFARQNSEENLAEKYLREVEADPAWPGLLHGYLVQPATVYENIHVGYTPDTETVLIHITCQIEPQRTN